DATGAHPISNSTNTTPKFHLTLRMECRIASGKILRSSLLSPNDYRLMSRLRCQLTLLCLEFFLLNLSS
ncbi:MAG: hypothetical protein WC786_06555, partial [Patescibacteria group bacterium]